MSGLLVGFVVLFVLAIVGFCALVVLRMLGKMEPRHGPTWPHVHGRARRVSAHRTRHSV